LPGNRFDDTAFRDLAAGGLISYGSSLRDNCRRAAGYVDRILKDGETGHRLPALAADLAVFGMLRAAEARLLAAIAAGQQARGLVHDAQADS
jgi:hypothetical protein